MPGDALSLRRVLEQHSDAKYLAKITQLVPSGMTVLGVRVPELRRLAREYPRPALSALLRLTDAAFAGRCREEMLFAIFLLTGAKRELTAALWPSIDRWIDQIDNWEICDQLAMGVAAPIAGDHRALTKDLVAWARAKNPWRRRFAAATAAALNQGGRSLAAEALEICAPLLADEDPMVQKAAGWALRETSKADADAVFALLSDRSRRIAPRVLREGAQKLPAARRAALLKAG
jgi:3-methyladenine DNA glycosylase AlkD